MPRFKTFGSNPAGNRLRRIEASPNYKDNQFRNLSETVLMTGNSSMAKNLWRFMNKPKDTVPPKPLPSIKTDLRKLSAGNPVIIWFGHSSYLIHTGERNILVDPAFSGHASPFRFGAKSFAGSNVYTVDDLPDIDLLVLTHDHYDHLDHQTVVQLRTKTKSVCTSMGVGSHLVYWGFDESVITELDWWESLPVFDNSELIAAPARHFSGRSLTRNKTLWSSFILKIPGYKIYIGGDSGYDAHFKLIGDQYGPFDIAVLESGQYNQEWKLIHMMPEETVQASLDLQANVLLPVHWGKFALSFHSWDEPIRRILQKAQELHVKVTTPLIGEPVILNQSYPESLWWKL